MSLQCHRKVTLEKPKEEGTMKTLEPVAVINSITAIIEAALALAVGFGLKWTPEQVGLFMALVVAVSNLFKTLWARQRVTPVHNPRDAAGRPLVPASSSEPGHVSEAA
jgi:hypothetical protein